MAETYTVQKGDTLNAIAQRYGFKNYKEAGITGYRSGNADLIYAGEKLTIGGAKAPTATQPSTANSGTAAEIINQNQDDDIAGAQGVEDAPTRDSGSRTSRYSAAFSDLQDVFGANNNRPTAPNFENTYNDLREQFDVESLENYVNDLQAEEEDIFATLRQRRTTERGKTVAMNVIEGRIGEAERQENERLDYVRRQKATAVRQLQNANAAIENLINFRKLDYDTARNEYNDKLQEKISLYNIAKGVVDAELTDEERAATNSRANLDIIYGAISEGKLDTTSMSSDMQYRINQMELSAGLPTGFYQNLVNQNPEGEILSTTTRTYNGGKYADVLLKQPDGSITSKSIYLGGSGSTDGSDTGDDDEITSFRKDVAGYIEDLDAKKIGWGAAFNALKAKYPQASNELIDQVLKKDTYYEVTREEDNDNITIVRN